MRQLFNPEYDYVYRTVPQKNSKNAVTTPTGAPDPSFYWTRSVSLCSIHSTQYRMIC